MLDPGARLARKRKDGAMKKLILGAVVAGGAVFGLRLLARHGRELCAGCGGSVGHCCHSAAPAA